MAKAKTKTKKDKGAAKADPSVATLGSHPRASRDLLRARGWGGLAGFMLVAWFSFSAGVPMADVALRALIGGTIGALAGWAVAVTVWRSLAVAEIRAAHRRAEQAREQRQGAAA